MNEKITRQQLLAGSVACPLCASRDVSDFMRAPDRFHMRLESYYLMHCESCSCIWVNKPPLPTEMSQHYDKDYHRAITAAGEDDAGIRWKAQREHIAQYKSGGSLLDIGCSSGGFLSTMRDPSWKLYGIEMDFCTAERARKNTGAEIFIGDAMDAPFAAESFDVVTTFDVLEHVYRPLQFVTNINAWLKPGGIYYAILPNIDCWEARMLGSYWYGLELPRHLFHFSPRSLAKLMELSNFVKGDIRTTPTSYLEHSIHYVCCGIMQKLGGSPTPLANVQRRGFAFKAIRKVLRFSVEIPFAKVASAAGAGASMEAVFAKPLR